MVEIIAVAGQASLVIPKNRKRLQYDGENGALIIDIIEGNHSPEGRCVLCRRIHPVHNRTHPVTGQLRVGYSPSRIME